VSWGLEAGNALIYTLGNKRDVFRHVCSVVPMPEFKDESIESRYRKLLVAEDNQLVYAGGDFTTLEMKIFHILVADIEKGADEFQYQRLPARNVAIAIDREPGGRFFEHLARATNGLMSKSFWRRKEEDVVEQINVMSKCAYAKGKGYIQAKFNEDMRPYLLDLQSKFTLFRLWEILPLKSSYSIKMFEWLMSFCKMKSSRTISVEELRHAMGCTETYERHYDFRKRVIDRAQAELDEHCTITFRYTEHKENRQTTAYTFKVIENEPCGRQKDIESSDARSLPRSNGPDQSKSLRWYDELSGKEKERADALIEQKAKQDEVDWSTKQKAHDLEATLHL
jgi:Protein involved in initiation of plasmid replication